MHALRKKISLVGGAEHCDGDDWTDGILFNASVASG